MDKNIKIPIAGLELQGILSLVKSSKLFVVFAHGSGSSRLSTRNQFVAKILQKGGISTLLFDLLTEKEDEIYENRFNIPLLAKRLEEVTFWLSGQEEFKDFKIGYFGASTGAAAALIAAASLGEKIGAVVSRGGRPDLAMDALDKVKSPVLLIVGGDDKEVIELNQLAYDKINAIKELSIIPGATHLFEEGDTLKKAAEKAKDWFEKYLI